MKGATKTLEKEIDILQNEIKKGMSSEGNYDSKLEHLIGEHYVAIDRLKTKAMKYLITYGFQIEGHISYSTIEINETPQEWIKERESFFLTMVHKL